MRTAIPILFSLFLGMTASAMGQQQARLADGPGKDVVELSCATCHSTIYIPMNSPFLSADAWKAEVTKMRTAFGAPIDDDAANAIIAYLAAHYVAPR